MRRGRQPGNPKNIRRESDIMVFQATYANMREKLEWDKRPISVWPPPLDEGKGGVCAN